MGEEFTIHAFRRINVIRITRLLDDGKLDGAPLAVAHHVDFYRRSWFAGQTIPRMEVLDRLEAAPVDGEDDVVAHDAGSACVVAVSRALSPIDDIGDAKRE